MESGTKRIVAIVLVVVIAISAGVGIFIFIGLPTTAKFITPGAPSGVASDHILRVGVVGDTGEITGDGAWEGTYLAVEEINEAGGVTVGADTYYFGLVRQDTDEGNPNLVTSRGIAAAERLVYDNDIQFAIGGFRTEAVLAYQEVFMDNDIIFMSVGVATDIFTDNVRSYYDRYKYYFRVIPSNATMLGGMIFGYLGYMIAYLNAVYGAGTITTAGILAEDLTWTESTVDAINYFIPLITGGAVTIPTTSSIRYDITLSAADMNTHMQTFIDDGVDILIPVISAQGGIMMMQQYAELEPEFVVIGIDVQSQLDTFWAQSNGACAYETVMQSLHNVNKTDTTLAFWAAFKAKWTHDPLYTACGAYDAVYSLAWAIETGQTIVNDDIIPVMETRTKANILANPSAYPTSPNGLGAIWPGSHEGVADYPSGYTLWVQWDDAGNKQVVPAGGQWYPSDAVTPMGTYLVAPWVHTAWSA